MSQDRSERLVPTGWDDVCREMSQTCTPYCSGACSPTCELEASRTRHGLASVLSCQTTCDGQPYPTEVHYRQADAALAYLARRKTALDDHPSPADLTPPAPDEVCS